jgi:hypothetical protein
MMNVLVFQHLAVKHPGIFRDFGKRAAINGAPWNLMPANLFPI